jgi:uncharacterized protein (TIRG00374 family)
MRASDHGSGRPVYFGRAKKLLRILVAAVLLYSIFSYIGLQTVLSAIGGADKSVLGLAFLTAIAVQLIVSYRLKRLTDVQGLDLPTLLVFEVNLTTRFYGLFLPGGNVTALLIRIFKFTRERSQLTSVVVSLFADRITATLSLCMLGLVLWPLAQPHPDVWWLAVFALATLACAIPTYLVFIQPASPWLARLATPIQRFTPKLWGKLSCVLQRSRQTGGKDLVSSLALSVLAHAVGIVGYWLIAQSLGMAVSLLTIAWIRSGMMLVTLLPVTIAGLGVREVAALLLLQHYGVESDLAVAFSMLVFAATIIGIGLLGGLAEARRFVYPDNR